jgi:diaminohydroxyphosphoribosylaminopyrimidine deaminase/5-amino-6-(5-phosphoribosylamino)uracil reductase
MAANREADESFMRRALDLARRGGAEPTRTRWWAAVIVEDGRVVAEGFHAKDGGPHAERAGPRGPGRAPKPGAAMYVTLEPCSTPGSTGACTGAIIATGIKAGRRRGDRPNPAHAGPALRSLRRGGSRSSPASSSRVHGPEPDLSSLDHSAEPLLAAKLAATLDGWIATRTGESKWITGEAARPTSTAGGGFSRRSRSAPAP